MKNRPARDWIRSTAWLLFLFPSLALVAREPLVPSDLIFAEIDGVVAVEAEHFFRQTATEKRAFYLTTSSETPDVTPDGDPPHVAGASGGAYLEILPDTRRTHDDRLIRGTNFSPEPGKMAILHYRIHFENPGRYHVWVRAHSTGSEDNGIHVGLDGEWPETGRRLQWCAGKRTWRWESQQRTEKNHCGEPYKIYLDIPAAGVHTIQFSMREDGFEFDKFLMTRDRNFKRPEGPGPAPVAYRGKLPAPFPEVKAPAPPKPPAPPSGAKSASSKQLLLPAPGFLEFKSRGYYVDQGRWLAVNPEENREGEAEMTFPFPGGKYHVTLRAVGENDGRSTYEVWLDDDAVGNFEVPLAGSTYEEGERFHRTWKDAQVGGGAIVRVKSRIASKDGDEFSRARWAALAFEPADAETLERARPLLAAQAASGVTAKQDRRGSPTRPVSTAPLHLPRQADGDGSVRIDGELRQWHDVTLTLDGPYAHEQDNEPNPFTDHRFSVTFTHEDGTVITVPGYFAADGRAAHSSAESGTAWRAHLAPDRTGKWTYRVSFRTGPLAALDLDPSAGQPLAPFDGPTGSFVISPSDKTGRDLRGQGRLTYVGQHYLQFAGSKRYFLKVGADAPETLLAYLDFDNTHAGRPKRVPLKSWEPHVKDWRAGDPTWKDGKGKGLIGAINYLSGKGCNAFSFLTYNAGGDGDNVWPFIQREDKLHYDASKLDQWGIVFEHGTRQGMYLHFKMQETEIDDHRRGKGKGFVPESLDGGQLGTQRKLYCRELVARYAHNLALNWNIGEENTQTTEEQVAMIDYIAALDAYDHNIVIHTYPNQQDQIYRPLLGKGSKLTGTSLQNSSLKTTHAQTVKWVRESARAGKPWIVAFDESGSAAHAQCPDLGYRGFDGRDSTGKYIYTQHEVRKQTLWGHLMGGGAGCEYYFGYKFAENDLVCEDWRSRDQSWDYCRIAIGFFHENEIPFWEMKNRDDLIGNPDHDITRFCFAREGSLYLVYLPDGGTCDLDLEAVPGTFSVKWFNPREGGELQAGSVSRIEGGGARGLSQAPADRDQDWLVVVRKID